MRLGFTGVRVPSGPEIESLINLLARLPGLGPRSARRVVLHLIARRETLMLPLSNALSEAAEHLSMCKQCYNIDTINPCTICRDNNRERRMICVVAMVGDLWALERTRSYRGHYHVLGGLLSALNGVGPDELNIETLLKRASSDTVEEVIFALSATVEGQTTAHYTMDRLREFVGKKLRITQLAHGMPVGGELDYLDDGTLIAALGGRIGI